MSFISISELYQYYQQYPSVTTDTRNIQTGDIFFALKGPSFNGNAFAQQALEAGAAYAVVDDQTLSGHPNFLLVEDVLSALQQLALHHRQQFNIPVIAITGSNGKTTTKELIHAVLSSQYRTYTTEGNLNNHIGIPLTLLRIGADAEMAVVEMGANHQKEIESYCQYTQPTHGLITNCGKAHLEGFGGEEGVRKGKGELFDFLRSTHGTAFACHDFEYFHQMTQGLKPLYWYGTQKGDVVGSVAESDPFLNVALTAGFEKNILLKTQLVGSYNVYNVLAACMLGHHFNISIEKIQQALEQYEPTNSRSQLMEKEGNKIILDAYNANPTSMGAAIENFARLHAHNKILFLGAMAELGETSLDEHKNIVDVLKKYDWKEVILVGGDFGRFNHGFRYFTNSDEASSWWRLQNSHDNYLLVKGSRSSRMEKIVA